MPELPEVEILVRHLRPRLIGQEIRTVEVSRSRVLRPTSERSFRSTLEGARFYELHRRAKFLVFTLKRAKASHTTVSLIGHLGMTGRIYIQDQAQILPKHTAVSMELTGGRFVFEDARYFGRMTLDTACLHSLGPEPWDKTFSLEYMEKAFQRSTQAVKVRLLDQSLVSGLGNIYASEALFRAKIPPSLATNRLTRRQIARLRGAIRQTLEEAIRLGSTLPLDFKGQREGEQFFYFGTIAGPRGGVRERFRVYDREGKECLRCQAPVRRIVQASRSTYYCPNCQRS